MNQYEEQQIKEIVSWKSKEPSIVSQTMQVVAKPLGWLVNLVIPKKAILGALVTCNNIAELITDKGDILRDGEVNDIKELAHKDLKLSDKMADSVHNWANSVAGLEGGVTGATGLVGLIVDIPSLITMSLRVIHKIGLCYGFECNTEEDKQIIFGIMSAAGANNMKEKTAALLTLKQAETIIAKTTWKKMGENFSKYSLQGTIITVKALAKQLGINITKRKAAQAIPVVGGFIGAGMNVAFINDVAWAARRTFQERWLLINDKAQIGDFTNAAK